MLVSVCLTEWRHGASKDAPGIKNLRTGVVAEGPVTARAKDWEKGLLRVEENRMVGGMRRLMV